MTHSFKPFRRSAMRVAALALGAAVLPAALPGLTSAAHAEVVADDVRGQFQAADNPAILNDFRMDVFGGLEVTPIRNGRRGTTVVYRKVSDGKWEEAGLFKSERATYEYTRSGAFLWTSSDGGRRILLTRQGQQEVSQDDYQLNGRWYLPNTRNYNQFEMVNGDVLRITPYRNRNAGRAVIYDRVDSSVFRDRNGRGTYEALPNGDLLWKSNDSRNIQMLLTQ